MPGAPGMPGSEGGASGGETGANDPMSSGSLPDIGGGGLPGATGGQPGADGSDGRDGEAGQSAGSAGVSGTPGGDAGDGTGDGWERSNQVPEVPVDITAGSGANPDGVPSGAAGDLERALKDIDGGIMAERSAIRDRAAATPSAGGSQRGAGGTPGAGSAGGNGTTGIGGTGGNDTDPSGTPALPDGARTMAKAPNAPTRPTGVPKDIADARDDDVVARQLREAAMAETDPVIREKLWADYQKYKKR